MLSPTEPVLVKAVGVPSGTLHMGAVVIPLSHSLFISLIILGYLSRRHVRQPYRCVGYPVFTMWCVCANCLLSVTC